MGGLRLITQPLVIAFSMRFWVLYNGIAVLNTDGIVEPPDRVGTAPKSFGISGHSSDCNVIKLNVKMRRKQVEKIKHNEIWVD